MKKVQPLVKGGCTNCDHPIIDFSGKKPVKLPDYREQDMELNNGSLMKVGVCNSCKGDLAVNDSNAQKIARFILERHKIFWGSMGASDELKPEFHHSLDVVDASSSEKKFIERKIKHEKDMEKVRKDQAFQAEKDHDDRLKKEREEKEKNKKEKP